MDSSSFSQLSYQQQQDRWLEWRSRQLNYQEGAVSESPPDNQNPAASVPPVALPQAAPSHHQHLDQVLQRHAQAAKRLSAFHDAT